MTFETMPYMLHGVHALAHKPAKEHVECGNKCIPHGVHTLEILSIFMHNEIEYKKSLPFQPPTLAIGP